MIKDLEHALDILAYNIRLLTWLRQHELAREIRINIKIMTIIEQVRVLYPKNGNPDASKEEIGGLMLNLMPDEAVGKG